METNVVGILTEAAAANVHVILADETTVVTALTAVDWSQENKSIGWLVFYEPEWRSQGQQQQAAEPKLEFRTSGGCPYRSS